MAIESIKVIDHSDYEFILEPDLFNPNPNLDSAYHFIKDLISYSYKIFKESVKAALAEPMLAVNLENLLKSPTKLSLQSLEGKLYENAKFITFKVVFKFHDSYTVRLEHEYKFVKNVVNEFKKRFSFEISTAFVEDKNFYLVKVKNLDDAFDKSNYIQTYFNTESQTDEFIFKSTAIEFEYNIIDKNIKQVGTKSFEEIEIESLSDFKTSLLGD